MSTFPRNTTQHDLIHKGKALYYQSKSDGRLDEMEGAGAEELQVLRYSPKEMGRTIGHLLGCKLLHPSSVCCAPNKYLCLQIQDGPRTFSKIRGMVKSYSGSAVQIDMLIDTCCVQTLIVLHIQIFSSQKLHKQNTNLFSEVCGTRFCHSGLRAGLGHIKFLVRNIEGDLDWNSLCPKS